MATSIVELRCPSGLKPLLLKLQLEDERPHVNDENLMLAYCRDCTRNARQVDSEVRRVIHHFAFDGVLVRSEIER